MFRPEIMDVMVIYVLNGSMDNVNFCDNAFIAEQGLNTFDHDVARWNFAFNNIVNILPENVRIETKQCADEMNATIMITFLDITRNRVLSHLFNDRKFSDELSTRKQIETIKHPRSVQFFVNIVWSQRYFGTVIQFNNRLPDVFVVCNRHRECRVVGFFISIMQLVAEQLHSGIITIFCKERVSNNCLSINWHDDPHLFHSFRNSKRMPTKYVYLLQEYLLENL